MKKAYKYAMYFKRKKLINEGLKDDLMRFEFTWPSKITLYYIFSVLNT